MDNNHQRPDDDTPAPSEGIPAPEGAANLIDTDYVIGQDNITASPIGFNIDLHGKVFTISSLLIVLFVVMTLALQNQIAPIYDAVFNFLTSNLAWFFILAANIFVILCLVLVVSPLGKIRIGGAAAKPDFTYMGWFSMLFAAGMGIGLMFYGVSEPLTHFGTAFDGSDWAPLGGAVGDFDNGSRTGTDNSLAWASFLEYLNATGRVGVIGPGNYYIPTAPGGIPDAADHNVPEVDYNNVRIYAKPGAVLYAAVAETDDRGNTVTRPILKAKGDGTGHFIITGDLELDGGIVSDADINGSLGVGSYPNVASMIEISNMNEAHVEVTARHFAQNKDDRSQLGKWRRSAVLVHSNNKATGRAILMSPTRREGFTFYNNGNTDIEIAYRGNDDLTIEGNVSSPFNLVTDSTDPETAGKLVKAKVIEWSGAWTGSAINFSGSGTIVYDGNGIPLRGGNDGTNTATGSNQMTGGGGVYGNGIDIGNEIANGPTQEIIIKNARLDDLFDYSLLINRDASTEVDRLVFQNCSMDRGWRGLIVSGVKQIDGCITMKDFLDWDGTGDYGTCADIEGVERGELTVHCSGSGTANYEAPNLDTPITDATRYSKKGIIVRKSGSAFKLNAYTHDLREEHVSYPVTTTEDHDTYYANVAIHATTDNYITPSSGEFFEFGSAGIRALSSVRIDNLSNLDGVPLSRCDYVGLAVVGSVYGVQTLELGNWETNLSQGELLAELQIFNNDASGSNPGVSAAIKAFAADANGRGAYMEFWSGDAANPLEAKLRIKPEGIEPLNLPTSDPADGSGVLYSDSGTVKVGS